MLKRIISIAVCVMMLTSVAFASNTSVIEYTSTTEDGVTTVTATALATSLGSEDVKLFTAVYNADGSFAGAKKASTADGNLLKNSVTVEDGQTVKSFIWEGDTNTPVKMPATQGKIFTAADVEITFDGVSFEEFVGSALAFDAEDNVAEYAVDVTPEDADAEGNINIVAPKVKVKDSTIHYTVENDEEAYTTTITLMAGREVSQAILFEGKVSADDEEEVTYYRDTYDPIQKETIVISYNRNYFTEDMFENKDIGFIQNKTDYIRSYTFNYDNVVNSAAIEGKTAVLSEVKVDGVAVEGFSPDVFEYTVTVPAAQVNMPSVTFTPAGNANAYKEDTAELPGKTVITVTEGEATNTYTINYALSQEILATDFTIASTNITGFATYGYVPNAVYPAVFDGETVVSDTKVYTDRISFTNYHIREVNDDFLLGADLIRGSVASQKDATYTGNAIPDWIKFKAARGVTAVILCCEETGKTNFEANSFVQSTNNSGFIKTYTNQNKTYKYAYTKHFDANTTVQIPNAAESVTTSMLVALIWDDWVEPQTMQDITLHADALSKNALVILVPKNYQKDVLVQKNEDGTYSDITWVEDKTKAISAYDYEYDENGDPIFKWDASRATGDFCKTGVVNVTSGDATITSLALKSLFPTDGEYVLGSRPATDRYPIGGGHFLDNMPEELYNTNYIVVAFGAGKGYNDVDYTFSVNDNLKKIVVLDINDVANPTIGETVSTEAVFSGNDKPCYMMQSMQASHKVQAHNALSCFLAKGLMTEDDIYGSDGFKIRRYSVLMAIDTQGKNPIESMMSAELYARASDESREGDVWFFGESGMENTALVTDLGLTENITTNYSSKANQQPQIREFSSQAEELNELVFVNAASANYQGKTVSYPAWLEAEDCTYIAPYWNWTDISTKDDFTQNVYAGATAIDMYSFKVTKDCTVMMALKGTPDDFWALSEGWTKTALTDDDMIVINRQHRYPSQHFKYNQLFTKDFEAGSTVTIKTPQADKILPLVFVKPVDK